MAKCEVILHSKVYSKIVKKAEDLRKLRDEYYHPVVYLLGKDKKTSVIKDIRLLVRVLGSGCDEMPSISPASLHQEYTYLVKKKLVPCGLVRIGYSFKNDGYWNGDSGRGIYNIGDSFILTATSNYFRAEKVHKRSGHLILTVGISDK